MTSSQIKLAYVGAISEVARTWADPKYAKRLEAVEHTLACPNRYTREAIDFALDSQTGVLTQENLLRVFDGCPTPNPRTVGFLNAANVPLVGLVDMIACLLSGHRYLGTVSSRSPSLLPSILDDLRDRVDAPAGFADLERILENATALVATGTAATLGRVRTLCARADIGESSRLFRKPTYSIAILDGSERPSELEALAEDCLIHEGMGCRNVAVIFAPHRNTPDRLLDALQNKRREYPPHLSTSGSLEMSRAFMVAVSAQHASGEGFLVSVGPPEVQQPCHLRWVSYDDLDEVDRWLIAHKDEVQLVVTSHNRPSPPDVHPGRVPFGAAQRPGLDWQPDGVDVMGFLASL